MKTIKLENGKVDHGESMLWHFLEEQIVGRVGMNHLETRRIGKTGLHVIHVGLGGASLGGLYSAVAEADYLW